MVRKKAHRVESNDFSILMDKAQDPTTPPEELRRMVEGLGPEQEENPILAALAGNPSLDLSLLQSLAKNYPSEVLQNPVVPLLLLENPAWWENIERKYIVHWIDTKSKTLPEREQRLFWCDCAERVLPFYENEVPDDDRVRKAIEVARRYANGLATKRELDVVRKGVRDAYYATPSRSAEEAAAYAADSAAALSADWVAEAAYAAAYSASAAYLNASETGGNPEEAKFQERKWQWERLLQYLRASPNLPPPLSIVGAKNSKLKSSSGRTANFQRSENEPIPWRNPGRNSRQVVGKTTHLAESSLDVQEGIDRAFAYWMDGVGAKSKKTRFPEALSRKSYLDSLSVIKEKKRTTQTSLSDLGVLVHWQKDPELIRLVQQTLGQSPGYYNIMQVAESATPEEIGYWRDWYSKAQSDVRRLSRKHGVPFDVTAAIVAVLSPGNSWLMNLACADYILTHRTATGSSAYADNARKALRMLEAWTTDLVRGPKVTVFFESLRNPLRTEDQIVLDGHMINLWRGEKRKIQGVRQPSESEREQILQDFDAAANDLGLPPQSLQALTWYVWRFSTDRPRAPLHTIQETRDSFKSSLRKGASLAKEHIRQEREFWGDEDSE